MDDVTVIQSVWLSSALVVLLDRNDLISNQGIHFCGYDIGYKIMLEYIQSVQVFQKKNIKKVKCGLV